MAREETVNKDRFSYEGHWFNGAHIHVGAFVLSKAVSLSSNATKNRFFFGPRAHRLAPFSFSFLRRVALPRFAPPLGRSTCTFDHQVQGQLAQSHGGLVENSLVVSRQHVYRGNVSFIMIPWTIVVGGLIGSNSLRLIEYRL